MADRIVPEIPRRQPAGRILKIRLWGTETDCAAVVEQLRDIFVVQRVSHPRRDLPPSMLVRVYVQVSVGEGPPEGGAAR